VVTKLDRPARSLPDARDIADELTAKGVVLSLGGSTYDPTDPVGRLLFNVPGMVAEGPGDEPCPSSPKAQPKNHLRHAPLALPKERTLREPFSGRKDRSCQCKRFLKRTLRLQPFTNQTASS
jgi:hypothetical protein